MATRNQGRSTAGARLRLRRAVALALVLLSALGLLTAATATWAKRTVLDTDRFTELAADVLDDPRVIDAVTRKTTEQVLAVVERHDPVGAVLPDELAPLQPFIDGALAGLVEDQVRDLVESDRGREVLVRGVRVAHGGAMRILSGDGLLDGQLTVEGDQVTLDLRPLVVVALTRIQDRGRFLSGIDLPEPSDPDAMAQLEEEFDITLPEGFGRVTVYDSEAVGRAADGVAQAQSALALFQRGLAALWVITVLLAAGAFLVSPNRLRTLFQYGVAVAAAMAIQRVVVERITTAVPEVVASPDARTVTSAAVSTAAAGLQRLTLVLLVLGVVMAVIGWASSRPRPGPAEAGAATRPSGAAVAWVGANPELARVGLLAVLVALLSAWGLSVPVLVVTVSIAVVALAAVGVAVARLEAAPAGAGSGSDGSAGSGTAGSGTAGSGTAR